MTTDAKQQPFAGTWVWLIVGFALITCFGTVMTMRRYPGHPRSWALMIALELLPVVLAFRAKRFLSEAQDPKTLDFALQGVVLLYMALNNLLTLMSGGR